jgi:hypothetical protein
MTSHAISINFQNDRMIDVMNVHLRSKVEIVSPTAPFDSTRFSQTPSQSFFDLGAFDQLVN